MTWEHSLKDCLLLVYNGDQWSFFFSLKVQVKNIFDLKGQAISLIITQLCIEVQNNFRQHVNGCGWWCSNKILFINMGSGPDFAHWHTSLPSPALDWCATSFSGESFVDLWLALYSQAKIGRMRSQEPWPHCSPRSVASLKSCLGIASLDNFTQQCQGNTYQYYC